MGFRQIKDGDLQYQGEPVKIVGDMVDLTLSDCTDCCEELEAKLIDHNKRVMATIVTCPKHREKAWSQVYLKETPGKEKCYKGADPRFDHSNLEYGYTICIPFNKDWNGLDAEIDIIKSH